MKEPLRVPQMPSAVAPWLHYTKLLHQTINKMLLTKFR